MEAWGRVRRETGVEKDEARADLRNIFHLMNVYRTFQKGCERHFMRKSTDKLLCSSYCRSLIHKACMLFHYDYR